VKQLKKSTIKSYSVKQLAKHADRYQDYLNLDLFRFDFAYGTVYSKEENIYTSFVGLYDSSYNKMMMIHILNSLYSEAKKVNK
tara:strand:- start:7478 stop:7726 length:249 start_codon:yes stop_codon:yes gene_type:complete